MSTISKNPIMGGILGVIVGDAVGLPVQFEKRSARDAKPVTEMIGYGVFNLPPGSWSDDSSLTLCLVDALTKVSPQQREQFWRQLTQNFCQWIDEGFLTPFGYAYDIGGTTMQATDRLRQGISPLVCGGTKERNNGNGSLMRILPLAFYYKQFSFEELITLTHQVGSVTHAHPRANVACGIYIAIAVELLQGKTPQDAYQNCIDIIRKLYQKPPYESQLDYFHRILKGNIHTLPRQEIFSSGYVVDTLEVAFWCLLTTDNYADAVLTAVNLGEDTDTTAAVTGGLAGIYYGLKGIPAHWLNQIKKLNKIVDLVTLFSQKIV